MDFAEFTTYSALAEGSFEKDTFQESGSFDISLTVLRAILLSANQRDKKSQSASIPFIMTGNPSSGRLEYLWLSSRFLNVRPVDRMKHLHQFLAACGIQLPHPIDPTAKMRLEVRQRVPILSRRTIASVNRR